MICNKKNLPGRRLLALLLALTMLVSVSLLLTGCKKDEEESPTGLRDHVDQKQETEAAQEAISDETTASPESQLAEDFSPIEEGWYQREDGSVLYYQNWEAVTGFFNVENFTPDFPNLPGWYFFNEQGIMQKGCWITYEGNSHLLEEDGLAADAGWYQDETGWYCLGEMGMLLRSQSVPGDGVTYNLNADGYLYEAVYAEITGVSESGIVGIDESTYLVLDAPVSNCKAFCFTIPLSPEQGADKLNKWEVQLRIDGEWVNMKGQYSNVMTDGQVTITFQEVQSFDAVLIAGSPLPVLFQNGISSPTVLNNVIICY